MVGQVRVYDDAWRGVVGTVYPSVSMWTRQRDTDDEVSKSYLLSQEGEIAMILML